jgi:hypothetical protein
MQINNMVILDDPIGNFVHNSSINHTFMMRNIECQEMSARRAHVPVKNKLVTGKFPI